MNKKIEEVYILNINDFYEKIINDKSHYYRGESNCKYSLNSTVLRKTKKDINFEKLNELISLQRKEYYKIFTIKHSYTRFLIYMQHSISFSPFIDLTKNPWIALSFVLSEVQEENDANIKTNAAIYGIKLHENKGDNPIILSTAKNTQSILENIDLSATRISDINPYIIELSDLSILNDRMQYQQGAFLLLQNDSLNHKSAYNQENVTIVKYILPKELLKELFFNLREEHPYYTIKYLYNPYEWFRKIQKYVKI